MKKNITFLLLFIFIIGQNYAQYPNFLLNRVGVATPAKNAFSVRRLSDAYTGAAMEVLRTSDNNTILIGFTSSGDLDTNAMKAFAAGSDLKVITWFNQANYYGLPLQNGNATYSPRIVHNGIIDRENGQPFIRFFGSPVNGGNPNWLTIYSSQQQTQNINRHVSIVNNFKSNSGCLLGNFNGLAWYSDPPKLISSSNASNSVKSALVWQNGIAVSALNAIHNQTLMVTHCKFLLVL